MKQLQDKIAVVTGGAGVLCSALVRALLREGAKVALIGRTASRLEALCDELATEGYSEVIATPADVLKRDQLEQVRETVRKTWGAVDILVNGAGGNSPKGTTVAEELLDATDLTDSFFGAEQEGFEFVFDLNFMGTLLPCQVFGADMAEAGRGCIINVSSMSALRPLTKVAAYCAAKAAVDNFTRWLAVHLAKRGIRVNALCPGFFLTEQNRYLLTNDDGSRTPRGDKIIRATPMGTFGDPEDLQSAVIFLASDASRFVTGVMLPVDGGFSAYAGV